MSKFYNESEEMYLETILRLKEDKENVHAIDISNAMNFSRASVSRAIQNLKNKGYIIVNSDESLDLSLEGKKYADLIFDRHLTLTKFLIKLGVDEKIAEDDACKIEHVVSDETINAIKKYNATH